jgi:hypothetical protein
MNRTLRQIVEVSLGGSELRVRLSNVFGTKPVVVGSVQVGLRDKGANTAQAIRALNWRSLIKWPDASWLRYSAISKMTSSTIGIPRGGWLFPEPPSLSHLSVSSPRRTVGVASYRTPRFTGTANRRVASDSLLDSGPYGLRTRQKSPAEAGHDL